MRYRTEEAAMRYRTDAEAAMRYRTDAEACPTGLLAYQTRYSATLPFCPALEPAYQHTRIHRGHAFTDSVRVTRATNDDK